MIRRIPDHLRPNPDLIAGFFWGALAIAAAVALIVAVIVGTVVVGLWLAEVVT